MEKKKLSLKDIGPSKIIILFAAGILIIFLSVPDLFGTKKVSDSTTEDKSSKNVQNDTNTTSYNTNTYITEMETKLENILKKVSGIGDVEVMITLKASGEQVPLKDNPSTQESLNEVDGEGGSRTNNSLTREEDTVLVTNENGDSVPYIIQEYEPQIQGVVVIAEGGDNAEIVMNIIKAAEVLFDVPAHKVKVMKMGNR
ncbi:MAG: hypothetical protein K0R00_3453 [Herbinix sp.]|jgi:stage III sporulation protein AG|nr:hypothetical protein [Herbinix sp.]